MTAPLHYAVLQPGARQHYAVPALLARAGRLAALYIDIHGDHPALRRLAGMGPLPLPALRRLLARRLPADLPPAVVRDAPLLGLALHAFPRLSEAALLARARRQRFAGAQALYSTCVTSDTATFARAGELGLQRVHELFLHPLAGRVLWEESRRFPGLQRPGRGELPASPEQVERFLDLLRRKWAHCERVLVPSPACLEAAVAVGCPAERLRLVPYGIDARWLELPVDPEPGRLLMVGQVGLRKGSADLAAACRLLRRRGVAFRCRVAGPLLADPARPELQGPTYLGPVPRSHMCQEFARADVFVLPSQAEGMALAALEALACGIPVVTTAAAGSPLRHGIEGFLVPERDPQALADRLQQLIDDRALRARLGAAARRRAAEFTWEHYGRRLLAALPG